MFSSVIHRLESPFVAPLLALVAGLLINGLWAPPARADVNALIEALAKGTPLLNIRYRFENVSQDGIARDANANTVRTRFGYRTGTVGGASVLLSFENIGSIGRAKFNSTVNGRGQFPVVADPSSTEVDQAYLNFDSGRKTTFRGGRQVIILDNHRWVGNVGFRQNEQSFDAVRLTNKSLPNTVLDYAWIGNVNRIFGDRSPVGDLGTSTHIFHLANSSLPIGTITGYAYLVDIGALKAVSTRTLGVRLKGAWPLPGGGPKIIYTAEYANQGDYAGNPASYSVDYVFVEGGISHHGLTLKGGYEELGSNGTNAVTTPLATLHAFNGWADIFLATPASGLRDAYGSAIYKTAPGSPFPGLTLIGVYHRFSADKGGATYGREWDFRIARKIAKPLTLAVKYANYNAKTFKTDTKKLWFSLIFNL